MKKSIFFGIVMIFIMSALLAFAGKNDLKSAPDNSAVKAKTENKLSDEEISVMAKRVEEIRAMDKSNMTVVEKRGLRKELKGIKSSVRRDGIIYIGGGTLLLIIILIIVL